jgi:hypothetical protein
MRINYVDDYDYIFTVPNKSCDVIHMFLSKLTSHDVSRRVKSLIWNGGVEV